MSFEKVLAHLAQFEREGDVVGLDISGATVELAARAAGCGPARIAKTLSFSAGDRVALVVRAGAARVADPKLKAALGARPRMLPAEEAVARTGHTVRGVCPPARAGNAALLFRGRNQQVLYCLTV